MKSSAALAAALLTTLVLTGCSGTQHCPNVGQSANDYAAQEYEQRCPSKQDVERDKHSEEVQSELHEAEDVLKKRRAEETASAVEGIEGGG
jgi:hypothetical protein